jgi:4-amino-4-deoxy-L-arabinose transferase-like glycosyltransferase
VAGAAILLLFLAAFGARASASLSRPFTNIPGQRAVPVDSYNDAVFSLGGRALLDRGPVAAKLGADFGAGDLYADHPPLVYVATAASQAVVGDRAAAAPILAFAASIAAALLLYVLLRELGLHAVTAAVTVAVGLSIPLFLDYGTMLDTLMLGLPFAVAYLLVWQRSMDERSGPAALAAAAAAVALVAWEGAILVVLAMAVTATVRRRAGVRIVIASGVGLGSALIATVLWVSWVGGISDLFDKGLYRGGQSSDVSVGQYVRDQWQHTRHYFGVAGLVLLAVGACALLIAPRFRAIGVVALATPVIYALAFREGADLHDYWNYWLLIPMVLGIGALTTLAGRVVKPVVVAVAVAGATGAIISGFAVSSPIAQARTLADRTVDVLAPTRHRVAGQRWVPVLPTSADDVVGGSGLWLMPAARYNLDVPLRFTGRPEIAAYARQHPRFWVVVGDSLVRGRDALIALGEAAP